jgi:hypothetical protein
LRSRQLLPVLVTIPRSAQRSFRPRAPSAGVARPALTLASRERAPLAA